MGIFWNKNIFWNIFRVFCSWEQNSRNGKSKYSGIGRAAKRTLTCIFQLFLFRIDPKRTRPEYKSRIIFKILLLTYKALNGHSPTYLTSFFNAYKPARSLRSSGQLLLQVPDVKTCSYGQRSFFRLFCLVTKENGKNWDHWWHSLTHIFVYSQGTVLICQGNTFRCGR